MALGDEVGATRAEDASVSLTTVSRVVAAGTSTSRALTHPGNPQIGSANQDRLARSQDVVVGLEVAVGVTVVIHEPESTRGAMEVKGKAVGWVQGI